MGRTGKPFRGFFRVAIYALMKKLHAGKSPQKQQELFYQLITDLQLTLED